MQAKAAVLSLLSQIPLPEIPHGEEGLFESIYLLLTSVIVVPLVCKLPGGSPVLGFLVWVCQPDSLLKGFSLFRQSLIGVDVAQVVSLQERSMSIVFVSRKLNRIGTILGQFTLAEAEPL